MATDGDCIEDQMWEYQPGMPGIKRAWIDNPDLD